MAQRLPTRRNPDDRLNQRVLAGTMIKAPKNIQGSLQTGFLFRIGIGFASIGRISSPLFLQTFPLLVQEGERDSVIARWKMAGLPNAAHPANGSRSTMVSARSGLVEIMSIGASVNSSTRRR